MSCRDQFSPPLSPSIESLIVRYWLKHFLPTNSIAQSPADEKQNAIGQQKMFQPIAYDQWLCRRKESRGLNWSRQDISALDLQCLPPGSGHGSPKRGITRLYGRIFPERFVTKNSYQPSIKIIVSCGAFKTASSGMVRLVHGTHPLIRCFCQWVSDNIKIEKTRVSPTIGI